MEAIIVTGPMACGKTHNKAKIAALYGIPQDRIIDNWLPGQPIQRGHLHLTFADPPPRKGVRVVRFDSLNLS